MTRQQELIRRRASNRQFLLSQTDPEVKLKEAFRDSTGTPDPVCEAYPQLRIGQKFLSYAMASLENSEKFSALVVRLDKLKSEDLPSKTRLPADILLDAAQTIDNLCRKSGGLWGRLKFTELGCFFPGKTNFFALKTAKKIRKVLADRGRGSVSIGLAAFPCITYTKPQIIDNAYKALTHAAFFGPGSCVQFDAVSLNISGDTCYHNGDLTGAIGEFKQALLLDPTNVNVLNSLGVCYGIQGAFEKALDQFDSAIRLDPGEVMSIYNAGLVHMLSGRQDKALACFLGALNIAEDIFEILFQTGRLYLDMGDFEKARRYLEKAAERNPSAAAVYRYLGDSYVAAAIPEKAVSSYRKAIKLNPNDAATLSALGYLFDEMGENAEIALMFCRQSIEIAPENALYHHRLGSLYFNQNQLEAALAAFQKALKLGHDSSSFIETIQNRLTMKAS